MAWGGAPIVPWFAVAAALAVATAFSRRDASRSAAEARLSWLFGAAAVPVAVWLLRLSWPALLPPATGSDLAHHLALVDVLDRTRHLVDDPRAGLVLGEMAHYTPGLHLVAVILAAVFRVDAWRAVHPVVITAIALKAGFLALLAHRALDGTASRRVLAVAAVALVCFAPQAYGLGSVLESGFLAQVVAETFVVAGAWTVGEWHVAPTRRAMSLVGLIAAATFLVWPIFVGPLAVVTAIALVVQPALSARERVVHAMWAAGPGLIVAAMHLSRHAAWVSMAGVGGAVPAFGLDVFGVALLALAVSGMLAWAWPSAAVSRWLLGATVLQAAALWGLAQTRGAESPYMAAKMLFLAAYPLAVLAAVGLATLVARLPQTARRVVAPAVGALVIVTGVALAARVVVPSPMVSVDLDRAGRFARASLDSECVGYVVATRETAYWLHLAVMGQPRVTDRTARLDDYSANAAIGQWIDGTSLPYAVADVRLLPIEVTSAVTTVRTFGTAAVIARPRRDGDPSCEGTQPPSR